MVALQRTDSSNSDFRALVEMLDQYLAGVNGEEHSFFAPFNTIDTLAHVVVASENAQELGCGAFKEFDATTVEIKRMFVRENARGKGIAGSIVRELETWAAELGYSGCILETSKKLPEAIGLYQKLGFTIIPNYGQYENVETSVCMKKSI
jgi:GNAT superfamily N-acetyltransferase